MCQKEVVLWLTSGRLGPRESLGDSSFLFPPHLYVCTGPAVSGPSLLKFHAMWEKGREEASLILTGFCCGSGWHGTEKSSCLGLPGAAIIIVCCHARLEDPC